VVAAQQAAAAAQGGGGRGGAAGPVALMIPGQAWLLATTNNSVVAFKITDAGGKPSIQPGWTSRTLSAPTTPVIVNNVVFAVSSGKPAAAAGAGTPAVLYALDGTTGKDLWNSGTTLKTYMPGRSLWTSNSQVYVGGNDGGVYAFGFPLERK
jgi:outer membrane protein assembly factor BamB